MLNRCYKRFNKDCTQNAYCDETNTDYPECVCHEGFHGDGRHFCEPNLHTSSTTETTTTTTRQRIMISNGRSKEASSNESPFLVQNWNSIENAASVAPSRSTTQFTTQKPTEHKIIDKLRNHNKNKENSVVEDELLLNEGKADSIQEDVSERSKFLMKKYF